jgi:hypothetical protein
MTADFGGFNISPTKALEVIQQQITGVETLKFLKQGRVAELGFLSSQAVRDAITQGLILDERQIPLTRCYTLKASITQITIRGLPCYSKEETETAIQEALTPFGQAHEVQLHYYPGTHIRMDSAVALLEVTEGAAQLPRRLLMLGTGCDLFWKGAGPFCYYCKGAGHWVTACEKLVKRKQRSKALPSQPTLPVLPHSPQSPSPLPPLPVPSVLVPTPRASVQTEGQHSLKRSVGTRPTADTPEHSFIAEETPPLERRQKKKAKGKQKQEIQREPSPSPVVESRVSSPLVSPMNASPNLSDDDVVLAPVASPVPFGPPVPPGFQRLERVTTPPPPLSPPVLPATPSRRQLYPLNWKDATPPGTPYDGCSSVDIELEHRLARVYTAEEIAEMRKEIEEEKYQQYLENFG